MQLYENQSKRPVLEKNWPVRPSHKVAPGFGVVRLFLQQSSIDTFRVVWVREREGVNAYRKINTSIAVSSIKPTCIVFFVLITSFREWDEGITGNVTGNVKNHAATGALLPG